MSKKPATPTTAQSTPRIVPGNNKALHPRNKHGGRYDFAQLIASSPELAAFVKTNAYGDDSIDFADADAVRAINRALLKHFYKVDGWNLPAQYLCPPIPGRADYLHHLADLLAIGNGGGIPYGNAIRILDIGVGANGIYPLIGHSEYGWSFVGTDIDPNALACAQATLDANISYRNAVELRHQPSRAAIFKNVLHADELFELSLSNPPFHASIDEAMAGTERKWKNLGKAAPESTTPKLNFSGQHSELCCTGGEEGFICRMIAESALYARNCLWFTTLVSKATTLPTIYRALKAAGVHGYRTIEMTQGQKKSRIVAWTFLNERQQQAWRSERWGAAAPP